MKQHEPLHHIKMGKNMHVSHDKNIANVNSIDDDT